MKLIHAAEFKKPDGKADALHCLAIDCGIAAHKLIDYNLAVNKVAPQDVLWKATAGD